MPGRWTWVSSGTDFFKPADLIKRPNGVFVVVLPSYPAKGFITVALAPPTKPSRRPVSATGRF